MIPYNKEILIKPTNFDPFSENFKSSILNSSKKDLYWGCIQKTSIKGCFLNKTLEKNITYVNFRVLINYAWKGFFMHVFLPFFLICRKESTQFYLSVICWKCNVENGFLRTFSIHQDWQFPVSLSLMQSVFSLLVLWCFYLVNSKNK